MGLFIIRKAWGDKRVSESTMSKKKDNVSGICKEFANTFLSKVTAELIFKAGKRQGALEELKQVLALIEVEEERTTHKVVSDYIKIRTKELERE